MTEPEMHPDDEARVRAALWGGPAPGAEARSHLETCEPCRREVALYRRIRDTLRRLARAIPASSLVEAARERVEEELLRAAGPGDWVVASPVFANVGVRSTAAGGRQVTCVAGGWQLDALLHPGSRAGAYSVSGQVVGEDGEPASDLGIGLFVDLREAQRVRTNAFGEFEFSEHEATRLGLRIGQGAAAPRVEIWSGGETR